MSDKPPPIERRKDDHIDIVMGRDVGFGPLTTGFEAVRFVHEALPELSLAEIDLTAHLFGRPLRAPFLISSMTGGPARAEKINAHLSEAAEALGIGLAIGSQRIALEHQGAGGLSAELRHRAPSVPIIGNLGAAQIVGTEGVDRAKRAIEMIGADGLFIHLNPLQEAVQAGGDTDWRGVIDAIADLAAAGVPIAVKEVGFGLSSRTVRTLYDVGVTVLDVAGAGGTNWARVEGARADAGRYATIAAAFTDWGIPTTRAIMDARAAAPEATLIASGGIRDGVDAAKAIRLGADLVGQAAGTLGAAVQGSDAVVEHFSILIDQLRLACFCTGSGDLASLRTALIV